MKFKYKSGEVVSEGDKIALSGTIGYIGGIFQPLSEDARCYSCEKTGGVFITDDLSQRPGWILLTSTENAEDLSLVSKI
jgi:hypothetical protein